MFRIKKNTNLYFFRTWETLPKLPGVRGAHGCTRVTMNSTEYLIVFGGSDGIAAKSDIIFYNIANRGWEMYPNKIRLPEQILNVQASIALQLDVHGCNLMILSNWPSKKLYVCEGNYNWKWIDTTGKNDLEMKYVTVGANELLPCGI